MNEDMKRILEELEQDLLDDDVREETPGNFNDTNDEDDFDAILARILAESEDTVSRYGEAVPAFEDPDKPEISPDPEVYCNYSNDYGNDAAEQEEAVREDVKSDDKWLITLMGVASVLCLGIIGVLAYWLEAFLK